MNTAEWVNLGITAVCILIMALILLAQRRRHERCERGIAACPVHAKGYDR